MFVTKFLAVEFEALYTTVQPKNNVLIIPHRYANTPQSPKLQGQVESQEMQKAEKERKMQKEKSGEKV